MRDLPPDVAEQAKRRLRKFTARADRALAGPIWDLGGEAFKMRVTVRQVKEEPARAVEIEIPTVDERDLRAAIAECRVFFATGEDCYLPSVIKALRSLVDPPHAEGMKPLAQLVNSVVRDGRLVGAMVYSGRVPLDAPPVDWDDPGNGLQSDDGIVMDYIYGRHLHEEDDRIARLEQLDETWIQHAALMQVGRLMAVAGLLRRQIQTATSRGWVVLD
jgi:hypothetical protein